MIINSGFGFKRFTYSAPSVEDIGSSYQTITINKTYVPSTQTNFVVSFPASLLSSSFFTALSSGGSPRFTTGDGSQQLAHEKVYLDITGSKGYYKILIPTVNGTSEGSSTSIRVYYDNGLSDLDPTHEFGRNAVWANNYKVVQHLHTTPDQVQVNSVGTSTYDMTGFTSIPSNKVTTAAYGGGNAHVYDGTAGYGLRTSSPVTNFPFTMGILYRNPNAADDQAAMIGISDADSTGSFYIIKYGLKETKSIYARSNNVLAAGPFVSGVNNTTWNLTVATWESATSRKIFFNNSTPGTDTSSYTYSGGIDSFCIGRIDLGTDVYYSGATTHYQDAFIMDTTMSNDRYTTLYNNYFQASFFTVT